jgi:large subunit ribosomal protein L24
MSQPRLKVKKGDTVMVITGKDRGKTGKILEARPSEQRVIVDGLNIAKKHQKPRGQKPGGILEVPQPIHVSNVMLVSPTSNQPVKVRVRREPDPSGSGTGQRVRYYWENGQRVDIDEA